MADRDFLRFAMPVVQGGGEGLGNELFPWAKAFIGARELGLTLLHPAWGHNRRKYRRYFGTSKLDWVGYGALRRLLPRYRLTEDVFRQYQPATFPEAVARFGADHGLIGGAGPCVVEFAGMWGGVPTILEARDFILSALLNTRYTRENLYAFRRKSPREKIIVGLHVRRGDFAPAADDAQYRGSFGISIPFAWFAQICAQLRAAHGRRIAFAIFSDARPEELAPLLRESRDDMFLASDKMGAISDMLGLASCDLIVCSVSSYSIWACGLSKARYVWFAPNLIRQNGRSSIWGHLDSDPFSDTRLNMNRLSATPGADQWLGRGIAVGRDGMLPEELHVDLRKIAQTRHAETDLIQNGSVPDSY